MISSTDIFNASILIVDDQDANVSLLEKMLRAAGYLSVTSTRNPKEVCELHRTNRYSLILLDLLMPGLDGFQVMEGLKEIETGGYLPVLVQTAQPEHKLRALKAGARDFVSKPFDLAEVLLRVHNMIEVRLLHLESARRTEQAEMQSEAIKASFKEISDLNTEIQNFYHTLSHELKTPLTSAREFVSILRDGLAGPMNATQTEYLGYVWEGFNQLSVCINDLLDATRLETGKFTIELQPVSVEKLVERAVHASAASAAGRQIALTWEVQPDLPEVPADEVRITQVITNLLNNALKFTPEGGRIAVTAGLDSANADLICCSVSDNGRGMAPEELEHIFDRLYQIKHGDATTEGGLGLGLYLCRELVRLHDGEIWVESEPGKGSTFTFVISKAQRAEPYILVVDDDASVLKATQRTLESAHLKVTTTQGGSKALQLIEDQIPAVVLLDLEMRDLDGAATLKELRKKSRTIPVIIYTGYPDGDILHRALESSPFTLLAKPCPSEELIATVRSLMKQEKPPSFGKQVPRIASNPSSENRRVSMPDQNLSKEKTPL